MSVFQAWFFRGQWLQTGYSGSTVSGLLLPGNRRTLVCWPGLFSSRVWLYGPLCLCDVDKELQADLSTLGRHRLGLADRFICDWSCGLADIKFILREEILGEECGFWETVEGCWIVGIY